MEENQKIPMRSQVKKEDTWAIEDMYATVEDWEKDFAAAKKVAEEAAEYAVCARFLRMFSAFHSSKFATFR